MPPEDHRNQKKIQCWIPLETWDKIVSLGYNSPTIAVTKAFEKLIEDPRADPKCIPNISPEYPIESPDIHVYNARIEEAQRQIKNLEEKLKETPDPIELAKLQERNEGLNMLIEEKNKRIEDLTREVGTLNGFAHYFKNVEVKQIEAPSAEKKPWWRFW